MVGMESANMLNWLGMTVVGTKSANMLNWLGIAVVHGQGE